MAITSFWNVHFLNQAIIVCILNKKNSVFVTTTLFRVGGSQCISDFLE